VSVGAGGRIRIPDYEVGQVQPTAVGAAQTPFSVIDTSGIQKGQALAGFGRDLTSVGLQFQQMFNEQGQRDDQRLGQAAFTKSMDEAGASMGEFMARRGPAALPDPRDPTGEAGGTQGVTADARKKWKEIFEKNAKGLSPRQREIAGEKFSQFSFASYRTLGRHEAAQRVQAEIETNDEEKRAWRRHAVNNFSDAAEVDKAIAQIQRLTDLNPHDTLTKKSNDKLSVAAELQASTIDLLARMDYPAAMERLVEHTNVIGPELSNALLDKINVHRVDRAAPPIVNAALTTWRPNGGDLTLTEISKGLRDRYAHDPDLQREVLDRFDAARKLQVSNEDESRRVDNAARSAAVAEVLERAVRIQMPFVYDEARTLIKESNDPDYVKKALKEVDRAQRGETVGQTDWDRYLELLDMRNADPDKLRKVDPYKEPLDEAQRRKIIGLIEDVALGKSSASKPQGSSFAAQAGQFIKTEKLSGANSAAFIERFEEEVEIFAQTTGKNATPVQMREIGKGLLQTVEWSGWNEEAFLFESGDVTRFDVDDSSFDSHTLVPFNYAHALRGRFQQRLGREPSREEILQSFKEFVRESRASERPQ